MRTWLGTVSAAGLACAIGCHAGPQVRPDGTPSALKPDMVSSHSMLPPVAGNENQVHAAQPAKQLANPAKDTKDKKVTSLPATDPSQLPAVPQPAESAGPRTRIVVGTRDGGERRTADDSPFGHATDYSWLTGELYYVQSHNCWRLRFAAAGAANRYGGVMTLTGDGLKPYAHDGQVVRVEGTLLNPETMEPQPGYWVRHLTVLKQAPTEGN